MILCFADGALGAETKITTGTATNFSNRLALVHANLSLVSVNVNDQDLFDIQLDFERV